MPRNPKRDRDDYVPRIYRKVVPPSGVQVYADIDKDSSVTHYEERPGGLNVTYKNRDGGSRTLYYAESEHVERMKVLAHAGDGLNAYVNRNKPVYSVESVIAPPVEKGRRVPLDHAERKVRRGRRKKPVAMVKKEKGPRGRRR